jgi:hypothetical protein
MDTTTFAVYLKRTEKKGRDRKQEKSEPVGWHSSYQKKQYEWVSICWSTKIKKKKKPTTNIALANQPGNINEKG